MLYLLGLGSNLGNRKDNLIKAIALLDFLQDKQVSRIYESEALLPINFDLNWNKAYLNCCVLGKSDLLPEEILNKVKKIELELGRPKVYKTWEPRIIDIDILLIDELIIDQAHFHVPHSEMHKRAFTLYPAVDIAKDLLHPVLKKTLLELKAELDSKNVQNISLYDQDSWYC